MINLKPVGASLRAYLADAENRPLVRRVAWMIGVVVLLVLSAVAIWGGHAVIHSYKPGIVAAVVLWAVFLGTTASLVLPNKVVVATFGGLVGVSASEVVTAAGLISVMRKQVTALAAELGAIGIPGGPAGATPDPFISWMIWLFVGIVGLLCLPAFFEKGTP